MTPTMEKRYQTGAISVIALLIVVAALSAHFRSLGGPFQFDDERDIVYRPAVSQGAAAAARSSPYRALTYVSYAVDWKRGGGDAKAFHVTNLAIHIMASLLLFFVLRRIFNPSKLREEAAIAAGAIAFAVHPVGAAAVDYISGRAGMISAVGGLLMVLIWLGGNFRGKWALLAAVEAVALLGKEDAVAFPLVIGAFWLIDRKGRIFDIAPSLIVAAIYGAARVFSHPVVVSEPGREVSLASHILIQPYVYFRAFLAWLQPLGLSVDHHVNPILSAGDVRLWLCGIAMSAAILLIAFAVKRGNKIAGIATAWFVLALAPQAAVPLADPISQNRWYFAIAGLAVAAAGAIRWVMNRNSKLAVVLAAAWLVCLFPITTQRAARWADPPALWAESVKLYPSAGRPWSNYAQATLRQGRPRSAVRAARRALEMEREDALTWNTLGLALKDLGKYEDALDAYDRAIFFDAGLFIAYINRANVLAAIGKLEDAETCYRQALRMAPQNPDAHYGLAWVLANTGRLAEAKKHLQIVLKINPDDLDAKQLSDQLK